MLNTSRGSNFKIFYFVFIVFVLLFLLFRNYGLYPVVFSDEYTYSKLSRLVPLAHSPYPNYLYFFIMSFTSVCKSGFLDCARLINSTFFVLASPFIFFIACKVTTKNVALLIAALAILGPINTYTAYFMPEALYFFFFWLFSCAALSLDDSSSLTRWFFPGLILGILSLIKPHALFLLPGLVLYFIFLVWQPGNLEWIKKASKVVLLFVFLVFLVKFSLGFLLAGKAGVTLFGSTYGHIVNTSIIGPNLYRRLILTIGSLKGHLLGLCLLFSVPIVILLTHFRNIFSQGGLKDPASKVAMYTLLVLVPLIIVVAFFTASVAGMDPSQTDFRLHMRYYDFAFPLLLIVCASQLLSESSNSSVRWRLAVVIPVGAAMIYSIITGLAPYTPSFVDCPELRGFMYHSTVFYLLSLLSLISLAIWAYKAHYGSKIFLFIFMPLTVAFSTVYMNDKLRFRLVPDVYDKAGLFTKAYLPTKDLSNLVVIGSTSEIGGLSRTLFYVDNPQASLEALPPGAVVDESKFGKDKEWLLVFGNHKLPSDITFQQPMGKFVLAKIGSKYLVNFKKKSWPGIISRVNGLSTAEPWGTWSSGSRVSLEFTHPLPVNFLLHLSANAFGPNVGKLFWIHLGKEAKSFSLKYLPEIVTLKFHNPTRAKKIIIDVPDPRSPKEFGLSTDGRRLGIALRELQIDPTK